jgi:hypothetical protein
MKGLRQVVETVQRSEAILEGQANDLCFDLSPPFVQLANGDLAACLAFKTWVSAVLTS